MKNYQTIILATDLGELSKPLLDEALDIAQSSKGHLHILHALEPFPSFSWGYADLKEFEDNHHSMAKDNLDKLKSDTDYDNVKTHLSKKPPKIAITELAKDLKADLIIVGRHTKDPLFGSLGSTASFVVNHASCDVLVSHGKNV